MSETPAKDISVRIRMSAAERARCERIQADMRDATRADISLAACAAALLRMGADAYEAKAASR